MKHTCPHCGEKTFSPLQKALCGGMTSAGRRCPACGGRCVNGKLSLIVSSVLRLAALIMVIYIYFVHTTLKEVFWYGVVPLIISFVLGFIFDMFFGKLTEALRRG